MSVFSDKVAERVDRMDSVTLKRQYRALGERVAFFESIVQSLGEGIVVLDEQNNITYANAFARELIDAQVLPPFRREDGIAVRELVITYPERRILELRTSGKLVKIHDVTVQRLREADDLENGRFGAVKELASTIAHEIGNPLNALSLNLQLMKRRYHDDQDVDAAFREVKRMGDIVREFLDAMRPARAHLAPGNVAVPIKDAIKALRNTLEDRKIRIDLNLPSSLPSVALDCAQMEQVFFNIIKNAIEAMKDGGELAIVVVGEDQDVSVQFRDSGGGMDNETLEGLFAAWRTTKTHGTGLGLMISKRIVAAHGGEIAVCSEAGEGTTFTVRLPRLEKRVRELS